MTNAADVLRKLQAHARPDNLAGMARYGMTVEKRLGVAVPVMRQIAKEIGPDHKLALALWDTEIAEARMLASMVEEPQAVTEKQMERWVRDLDSWDVCDQVCMNLFEKMPQAWKKIPEWAEREQEFVKRAAFALLACLAWHDRTMDDEQFLSLFPVLKRGATDERNYVKKAVNWALRNIGKRNTKLHRAAIQLAKEIQALDSKAARWIAADALRELQSDAVRQRLQERRKGK
jgi:3-methyladenine DNA glycosylase AlkD